MAKKITKIDKGVGISAEEARMLDVIAVATGTRYRSRALTHLVTEAAADMKKAEAPAELMTDAGAKEIGVHFYLTKLESNKLSELCAFYRAGEKDVIRHLIHAYYEAMPVIESPAEAEPTATQMPLPEPVEDDDKSSEAIETLKDDGQFRWMLLGVLGQISDRLYALNESRSADSAELGKITNQLRTLNNAVWNR
jgi:hypothetical protein